MNILQIKAFASTEGMKHLDHNWHRIYKDKFYWLIGQFYAIRAELKKAEGEVLQEIDNRDRWEERATNLAIKVGEHYGQDVGEHSSSNCPIAQADRLLEEETCCAQNTVGFKALDRNAKLQEENARLRELISLALSESRGSDKHNSDVAESIGETDFIGVKGNITVILESALKGEG